MLIVHGSSAEAVAWVLEPRSLPIALNLPLGYAVLCAPPRVHIVNPPESNLSQDNHGTTLPPPILSLVSVAKLVCVSLLQVATAWISVPHRRPFADHTATGPATLPSPWGYVHVVGCGAKWCGMWTRHDTCNLDTLSEPICLCMTAVDWSLENVRCVLLPRPGTSPGTISLHALCPPSRQMGSSPAYHPLSVIQYLRHLFSPKLCDCILGDPVTHSLAISMQTFSDRKMLEMNSFASTAAMNAAVASLSARQFAVLGTSQPPTGTHLRKCTHVASVLQFWTKS